MTYEERLALAMEGRRKGYNCSQAVVTAFPDVLNLPQDVALRLTCGFGSGLGGLQKVCGVLTAMAMLEGLETDDGIAGKAGVYKVVRSFGEQFRQACGALDCRDLKDPSSPAACNEIIAQGIRIYHDYLHSI